MKWEYLIVELRSDGHAADRNQLAELGLRGWELAAIGGTYGTIAYFKRPVSR
jgi:hypothetical protein